MTSFSTLLSVHLISIALSVGLLTLRFWLRYQKHPRAFARWTRIVPPVVDTLLLLSGIALMAKAHIQPFSGQAQWLTEKLFGVIIYIVLGFIALDYRRMHSQQARIIAFPLALVVLYIIIKLATTKVPLLGEVMRSLADFEFNKAPLCEGMILACEAIRRDFPSQDVYDELERLVSLAKEEISQLLPLEEQLEKLIALFYGEWGFKASRGVYRLSDALWLDQVLKNRQGSAVSLGAVLLWVANRLDLPLLPVIFPTQLILRIECPDGEIWLINPFNGESLSEHMLDVWLKGNISPSAELFYEDLDEADNIEVIRKLLDTLKASLMEENQMELALRTSEALLQFNPEDPYEIRDRGLIYAQLDCEHVALNDLSYFVEQCPEDPISEMIRAQINNIAHKHIVLH